MQQVVDYPRLNSVLLEAAKLTHEDRRARILGCVAEGRHNPDALPICVTPSQQTVRYCESCWRVIDPHGLTWSWPPDREDLPTAVA